MMSGEKVAPEQAEAEFDNLVDLWGIDPAGPEESDEAVEAYDSMRRGIISGIVRGRLTVNTDDSTVSIHLGKPLSGGDTELIVRMPTAGELVKASPRKASDGEAQLKLTAMVTGVAPVKLSSLPHNEYKLLTKVMQLFMSA